MKRNLKSDPENVLPVLVVRPGLLEPGEPERRHLDVVLDDDAEFVVRLRVPGVEPGRSEAVVGLEDLGSNFPAPLRQGEIASLAERGGQS